jgi:hypothetical protein
MSGCVPAVLLCGLLVCTQRLVVEPEHVAMWLWNTLQRMQMSRANSSCMMQFDVLPDLN